MIRFVLIVIWSLFAASAQAQNTTCSDRPSTDSSNACANTRFVQGHVPTNIPPSSLALPDGQIIIGNNTGAGQARSMSGDCTISDTGVTTCSNALPTIADGHLIANATGATALAGDTVPTTWLDHAFCSTVGYIIVRTTGAWVCAAGTPANVKWWGVKCDGVTDDSTNFATAIAATSAVNAALYFPGGTCIINNQTIPVAATIIGNNKIHTIITTTSATAIIFDISSFTTITDLTFSSSVTRTSGAYINITGSNNEIRNVTCSAAFTCLTTGTSTTTLYINTLVSSNVVSTSGNDFLINGCLDCHFYMLYAINGASTIPFSHIQMYSVGDLTCVDCSFLGAGTNVYIAPGDGQVVANVSFIGGFTDGAVSIGVSVAPTGTGKVTNVNFTRHWISGEGALPVGVNIAPAGTSSVNGISLNDSDIFNNTTGVGITNAGGGSVSFINIKNNKISGGTLGVTAIGVQHCEISGNAIGTVGGGTATTNGITISSGTNYCDIHDNDVSTVSTTGISNSSAAQGNKITNNIGYNPVGAAVVTTTGVCPYTYLAGASPEFDSFSASAGSITSVTINGGNILAAAVGANTPYPLQLSPNDYVVIGGCTGSSMVHTRSIQ